MVTGTLYLDLSTEPDLFDNRDRHTLAQLGQTPDGAHVIVNVGSRKVVSVDGEHWLCHNAERLNIEIRGTSTEAVQRWIHAARNGRGWAVVA